MTDFNPGDGWREVTGERVSTPVGERLELLTIGVDGVPTRTWVREDPVPPLPTEVGTVITIGEWRFVLTDTIGDTCVWFLLAPATLAAHDSIHRANLRPGAGYSPEFVRAEAEQHGGFEVLAEPRKREGT